MKFPTTLQRLGTRLAEKKGAVALAGVATAVLGVTAAWVAHKARLAEQDHPPQGAFVTVDGVRVHYIERGQGDPVVLLHGNVVSSQDFVASGLIDRLAKRYRVIAFDRPGFGYTERPRSRLWTAEAQAALLHKAFSELGIEAPIVVGHSWGTLVALALALNKDARVQRLVLLSGYYFPTARLDAVLASPPAIPVVGDVMRYTVSAVFARLLLGRTVKAMFSPQPVPTNFLPSLSRELLVRPGQIRANAADAGLMVPATIAMRNRYAEELTMPVVIVAGDKDKVVNLDTHARHLQSILRDSQLVVMPGVGHMVHHSAPDHIAAAVAAKSHRAALAATS